jgi:Tfp pilus assembly protein PilO
MKAGHSSRDQRILLLILALGLLIGWLYVVYIITPLSRESGKLGRDVRSAREKVRLLEVAITSEASLQEQYRQSSQAVALLRSRLPSEEELPAIIERLSALASQSQVKIQTMFPQRPVGPPEMPSTPGAGGLEPAVYKEIPIQIDALAGFHQLGDFLSLAESGEWPMRVASLRISANAKEPKRHNIKLLLSAYFATTAAKGGVL